jgi:hypothetical protein
MEENLGKDTFNIIKSKNTKEKRLTLFQTYIYNIYNLYKFQNKKYLLTVKSIIILLDVGKNNNIHNKTSTRRKNNQDFIINCNILNSFVPKYFHTVRNEDH